MKKRTRVSGGELAYVDEGEGRPVLLLHGFPTSSHLWRAFIPSLASRMRVVAPDLLGHGDSDKPLGAPLNIPAQAGYVKELLAHLEIGEYAIVGHDIGGAIAQLLALEGNVEALVLMDCDAFDAWPIEAVRMIQQAPAEQETPEFARDLIRLALELGISHGERLTEDLVDAYAGPFTRDTESAGAFFRAARGIDGEGLAGRDGELAALDIPVFVLWGEDDPYVGTDLAERLAETFFGSTLAFLPGCSHFLPEDAPETIVPLVYDYLRTRYLALPHDHDHEHGEPSDGPVLLQIERRGQA